MSTSAPELLASLRDRGLTLSVEWGQLLVSPRSLLSGDDIAAIRASRDELIALIDPRLAPRPDPPVDDWEEVQGAMADRAWRDPPDFGAGHTTLRESVILRLDGFPAVAISPEEAKALDALAAWNEAARERRGP